MAKIICGNDRTLVGINGKNSLVLRLLAVGRT
jgi:hypothetical protein